jgi:hypothetical protein
VQARAARLEEETLDAGSRAAADSRVKRLLAEQIARLMG